MGEIIRSLKCSLLRSSKAIRKIAYLSLVLSYREVVSAAEQGKTSDFGAVVKDLPQPPARDTYKSLLDTIDRSLGMIKQ